MIYASVQNGVVLDFHNTIDEARDRVRDEIKHDWLEIIIKKKLRNALRKSGGVSLNTYHVFQIVEVEEVK